MLSARGITLSIVTSLPARPTAALLEAMPIGGLFSLVDTFASRSHRKPSPLVLSAHLEHLGLRPADAAYIGDTPGDIQMARGAGVAAWGAGWSASGKATLMHAGAERILDRISDLQNLV